MVAFKNLLTTFNKMEETNKINNHKNIKIYEEETV